MCVEQPTIVVNHGKATEYPCDVIAKSDIVDQNGAGDAFVGGFLAQVTAINAQHSDAHTHCSSSPSHSVWTPLLQLVSGKKLAQCVGGGQAAARVILKQSGCAFPKEKPTMP